ncbi:MAG: PDZ domain-containing protein [Chitinophagaceae bacterium]
MKQYALKAASALALLALYTTASFAQDDKKENSTSTTTITRTNDEVIVIQPNTSANTTLTIEINGENVTVNGKPLADYKNDDVIISKRRQFSGKRDVENWEAGRPVPPPSRFRSGPNAFEYSGPEDLLAINGKLASLSGNKAFLGVGSEKTAEGVSIISISDKSAAEKVGLKEGDLITKLNDTKIGSPEELTKAIGKFKPEEKITITYKRGKKEQKTAATLGKRKQQTLTFNSIPYQAYKNFNLDHNFNFNYSMKPKLGLRAQETEDGKGLTVLDVDDESTAEKAGIREGDVITSFDGTEVNTIEKLGELSRAAIEKGSFKIKLNRDGKAQEIDIKIPKKLNTTSL